MIQALLNIFKKVFVFEYYKRNIGFFLFLFIVFFGMEQKPILFHRELITSIVSSKTELIITLIIFFLYYLKCLFFITRRINNKEYRFLSETQSYSLFHRIVNLSIVYIILATPFTIYAYFVIAFAIKFKYVFVAFIVFIFLIIIHVISIFICYRTTQNGFTRKEKFSFLDRLPSWKKPMLLLPVWYMINDEQIRLVVIKFFSFLLLAIMCIWNKNEYQFSDFILFFQFSVAAHALLIWDCMSFFESKFFIRRNLPISINKIFLSFLLCNFLVAVPEIIVMLYYGIGSDAPTKPICIALMYVGQLILFASVFYEKGMTKERYFTYVAIIIVVVLFLFMFKIILIMSIFILLVSFGLFASLFYNYEPVTEEKVKQ